MQELKQFCFEAIIRHYQVRSAQGYNIEKPSLQPEVISDLHRRWGFSFKIKELAELVLKKPGLFRSLAKSTIVQTQGSLEGAIKARETVLLQFRSGNPGVFIVEQADTTRINELNYLVSWVLIKAKNYVDEVIGDTPSSMVPDWMLKQRSILAAAVAVCVIQEIKPVDSVLYMPSLFTKRLASRTKNPLYQLAVRSLVEYEKLARLDLETVSNLVNESFISQLEAWQLLELATALAATRALSEEMGMDANLSMLLGKGRVVGIVGSFKIVWQNSLAQRKSKYLDDSEKMAADVAVHLGRGIATSRVDVSVIDTRTDENLAHFECKYSDSKDYLKNSLADAALQITRYVRDSTPGDLSASRKLLRNSFIIVNNKHEIRESIDGAGPVGFTDFKGLASGALSNWAQRIIRSKR